MRKLLATVVVILSVAVVVIQLVPYGRDQANPPVRREPAWDASTTRQLAARACYDCHSNETVWPWYSHVAPASWLVQQDVREGRRKLNFSEWDRSQKEGGESAKAVRKGKMPPWYYVMAHTGARLTGEEQEVLVLGLEATLGTKGRAAREREEKED